MTSSPLKQALDCADARAAARVVTVLVQPPRGATVVVMVHRRDAGAVRELERPACRNPTETVLVALHDVLTSHVQMRPWAFVLCVETLQVVRMLRHQHVSRRTHEAWGRLQRAFGYAAALGIQVWLADGAELVPMNEVESRGFARDGVVPTAPAGEQLDHIEGSR